MEPLDAGWAAIFGAGIGAAAAVIGSVIGPIVRDALARRATKADSARETRYRLAMQILEALDDVTGVQGDERREKLKALSKLTNEASLVDKRSELARMVDISTLHLSAEETLARNLIAGYTQNVITRWGRSDSIPTLQKFVDEQGRILEATEYIEAHRIDPTEK